LLDEKLQHLTEGRSASRPYLSGTDHGVLQITFVHVPSHGLDVHFQCISQFGLIEVGPTGERLTDTFRNVIHDRTP
jgi:hypothetical protein